MFKKIKETLAGLVLIGSLTSGGVAVSELTGLTDAGVQFRDAMCHAAYEAHRNYPLLVWSDYGNPHKNKKERLAKYRFITNVDSGLTGLFLGVAGMWLVGSGIERRKRKKEALKNNNPYAYQPNPKN